ncbi:YAP-binding/ALF4/Glomulin [Podospora conica]|nr:YAP-binding/ALF4/Glomulin [Schizothecium conicum]
MQSKLLLSFATCVLERYTNTHEMGWAARLVEYYSPEKLVPGRKTMMAAFREEQELLERDAIVGQLVALIRDLGIDSADEKFLQVSFSGPVASDPLSKTDDAKGPDDIALSTGGCVSLVAYWVFSETIFDADQPLPQMHIFPDHYLLLQKFLEDDAEDRIRESSGTIESLVAIGLWLLHGDRLSSPGTTLLASSKSTDDDTTSDFMRYLHLVTLVAVFHPRLHVRNASISLAGRILHADPSEEDRLRILYDLLENCVFSSLKACAITWLRDELLAGEAAGGAGVFASQQPLEEVQYAVFPNLDSLREMRAGDVAEYVGHNAPFLVQAANFGLFLWSAVGRWAKVLPANAEATVRERWWSPLVEALGKLGGEEDGLPSEVEVLRDRLARLEGADGFSKDGADRTEWVRKGRDVLEKEEEAVGKFW